MDDIFGWQLRIVSCMYWGTPRLKFLVCSAEAMGISPWRFAVVGIIMLLNKTGSL